MLVLLSIFVWGKPNGTEELLVEKKTPNFLTAAI